MTETTGLVTASSAVVLDGVDAHLISFAQHLAVLHKVLFGTDMVVTSGKDSIHVASSLHGQGKALDLRIKDLAPDAQMIFLALLMYAAPENNVAVFDERALPGSPHIHIEYHGA
jgi:hypothetical protein